MYTPRDIANTEDWDWAHRVGRRSGLAEGLFWGAVVGSAIGSLVTWWLMR